MKENNRFILISEEELLDRIEEYKQEYNKLEGRDDGMQAALVNKWRELESILSKGEKVTNESIALNDLFREYSHSKTKQTFESFVINHKSYKLIKTL